MRLHQDPWIKKNRLAVFLFSCFSFLLMAQSLAGWDVFNHELRGNNQATLTYISYLSSSHFWHGVFSGLQGEFLQLALLVFLSKKFRNV